MNKKRQRPPRPQDGKVVSSESEPLPERLPHGDDRPRGVDLELSFVAYPARIRGKRLQLAIEDLDAKIYGKPDRKPRQK